MCGPAIAGAGGGPMLAPLVFADKVAGGRISKTLGTPFEAPKLPTAPKMPKAPEVLKDASADSAAARDRTLKKMAARASIASTNATAGGLGAAATTSKTLLGE